MAKRFCNLGAVRIDGRRCPSWPMGAWPQLSCGGLPSPAELKCATDHRRPGKGLLRGAMNAGTGEVRRSARSLLSAGGPLRPPVGDPKAGRDARRIARLVHETGGRLEPLGGPQPLGPLAQSRLYELGTFRRKVTAP